MATERWKGQQGPIQRRGPCTQPKTQVFRMIQPGSPSLHAIHSLGWFVDFNAPVAMQGKIIAFTGVALSSTIPTPSSYQASTHGHGNELPSRTMQLDAPPSTKTPATNTQAGHPPHYSLKRIFHDLSTSHPRFPGSARRNSTHSGRYINSLTAYR